MPQQTWLHKTQEAAAGAIAQQCQADCHISEMVPLDDGKQPDQQEFVTERSGRQQRNRSQRRTPDNRA